MADYFVDQGRLIVYTEGRDPGMRQEHRARHPRRGDSLSLIVLLDHGSASAAEIVAGAVQDLDLGLIVGQTSFGKGLVQEQFRLSDGGLLLLTVARYYTPLGRLIQRPYTDDIQAYIQEGIDDVDPNATDSLRAAKEVFYTALGRPVYGGGGITPDILLKSEDRSDFMVQLFSQEAFFDFSGRWAAGRRDWPEQFADFLAHYELPETALEAFRAFLDENDLPVEEEVFAAHQDDLRREIKAALARVLWGEEQRYRIHVEGDRQILQALELFAQADELLVGRRARNSDKN